MTMEDCKDSVNGFARDFTVLVTGFGPFREHKVNSSWVTVKELAKLGIEGVNLVIKEIPVEYNAVLNTIPQLWGKHKPDLVIHCGMSSVAQTLVLEQVAYNSGYQALDVQGRLPSSNCCVQCGSECLRSLLNMHQVSNEVNSSGLDVPAVVSEDAGRYLCEFIYYTSLNISGATAFIHVPPLNSPYTAQQMAESMQAAICSMLKQIDEQSKKKKANCKCDSSRNAIGS